MKREWWRALCRNRDARNDNASFFEMNLSTRKAGERRKSSVLDAYTEELMCREPRGTSWGALKYPKIAALTGSTIKHVAALKLVRKRVIGQKKPGS